MMNNFTYKDYTELLQFIGETRKFVTFTEYQSSQMNGPIIILRHDIDYSPKYALTMANLEAELGIKSTYFFLFSSSFYNLLNEDNIQIARQIKELGHEIGLHYDVGVIEKGNMKDTLSLLNVQANILSNIAECPILSIAMHNPSISGKDIFRNSPYINAYADKYTKEMAYFSDSCMAWRNNFSDHMERNDFPPKIQLLIHPILWSGKKVDRWEKLDDILFSQTDEIKNKLEYIKTLWESHKSVIEHDQRNRTIQ